jgi:hypothetical protein
MLLSAPFGWKRRWKRNLRSAWHCCANETRFSRRSYLLVSENFCFFFLVALIAAFFIFYDGVIGVAL